MRNLSRRQFGAIAYGASLVGTAAATAAVLATAPPKAPGHVDMHQQGLEHTHVRSDLSHLPPDHSLAESGTATADREGSVPGLGHSGQTAEENASVRSDAKLTPEAYSQWREGHEYAHKIGPYGPYSEKIERRNGV